MLGSMTAVIVREYPCGRGLSSTAERKGSPARHASPRTVHPVQAKGESYDQTCCPVGMRAHAAARGPCPCAGIVPDHGEGRPEGHREIPDLVLSAVGPAEKPAPDRAKGADRTACHPAPAKRSADADRVPQPCGRTH